jgi:3-isopropylmalate dehydratase small subunit
MTPFTSLQAVAAPMPAANIDTDQILPKQFLSTVERSGLARGLFADQRFEPSGEERADFVLNRWAYRGAQILIAGDNFGCGSSREHAPWALLDFGIRCVIAPSFAEIFYNNCFNNGLLPAIVGLKDWAGLCEEARGDVFDIDLASQIIVTPSGARVGFEIDDGRKTKLLEGLDDIAAALKRVNEIAAFEARRTNWT